MSDTDTFIATLTQTPVKAGALLASLNELNSNLGSIINVLTYSKTVDDDLSTLNDAISTAQELLEVASVIPEVGEAAAAVNEALTALSVEVKPAKEAADSIEAEVKPVRDALQSVQSKLQDLINAVQQVQTTSQTFLNDFTAVVNCINGLPDGTYKTQGLAYLDQFSSAAEPEVSGLNTAMDTANNVITTFYSALSALAAALNPLQEIDSAIQSVLSALSPITNVLSSLVNDLKNITIWVPIPYPQELSLYDIFNEFESVASIIEQALAPIQDIVNQVLSALNIQLPQIPGLSYLLNLALNIPGIPDFAGLLSPITDFLNQLEGLIPTFSLTCPPSSPDAEVPGGGTYSR
ncbi:MAG TPA: hypothetical protein VGF77_03300 [Allosphingosinicella sp.]